MNYKLPILSVAAGLVVVAHVASTCLSQVPNKTEFAQTSGASDAAAPGSAVPVPVNGQELVNRAVQSLLRGPGLEAKTRQSVYLFNQKLVGSGSYCQLTNGPKLYLKLELILQMAGQKRSLQQISDGDSLWEIHGQGESQTFSHVNLGRLRDVAVKTNVQIPPAYWMALGGIPRLLAKLEENFDFQAPRQQAIGEHPVWRLEGTWKPSVLAQMLPQQKDAILAGKQPLLGDLPEQVPHGVTLILGRDNIIPLFPYSFSFYRNTVVDEETGETRRTPIVTWELFEVRFRPDLRRSHFDFRPNDQEIQERTDHYVARLKAAAETLPKRQ